MRAVFPEFPALLQRRPTERGRPTPKGITVSGNTVKFCSASTATSKGSPEALRREPQILAGRCLSGSGCFGGWRLRFEKIPA